MSKHKRKKLLTQINSLKDQLSIAKEHPKEIQDLQNEIDGYKVALFKMYKDNEYLKKEMNRYKNLVERLCIELEKKEL